MINFNFTRPSDNCPEGIINISVEYSSSIYFDENQFPLRLQHKSLSGEVIWNTDLYPGWFSEW